MLLVVLLELNRNLMIFLMFVAERVESTTSSVATSEVGATAGTVRVGEAVEVTPTQRKVTLLEQGIGMEVIVMTNPSQSIILAQVRALTVHTVRPRAIALIRKCHVKKVAMNVEVEVTTLGPVPK